MAGLLISPRRRERLWKICEILLTRIREDALILQRQAESLDLEQAMSLVRRSEFDRLATNLQLLVACACVAPERISATINALAESCTAPAVHALLTTTFREILDEQAGSAE